MNDLSDLRHIFLLTVTIQWPVAGDIFQILNGVMSTANEKAPSSVNNFEEWTKPKVEGKGKYSRC